MRKPAASALDRRRRRAVRRPHVRRGGSGAGPAQGHRRRRTQRGRPECSLPTCPPAYGAPAAVPPVPAGRCGACSPASTPERAAAGPSRGARPGPTPPGPRPGASSARGGGGERGAGLDELVAQAAAALPGDRPGRTPRGVERFERVTAFFGQRPGGGADRQLGLPHWSSAFPGGPVPCLWLPAGPAACRVSATAARGHRHPGLGFSFRVGVWFGGAGSVFVPLALCQRRQPYDGC